MTERGRDALGGDCVRARVGARRGGVGRDSRSPQAVAVEKDGKIVMGGGIPKRSRSAGLRWNNRI